MDGIITELNSQIAALREELAAKDSEIGALRQDVIVPLETELRAVKDELAACQAAQTQAPKVTSVLLEAVVSLADGSRVLMPVTAILNGTDEVALETGT